tara:strand:- start:1265 stop:1783 length:519 start_codon:yes stop_codon:yes gene_type:complete
MKIVKRKIKELIGAEYNPRILTNIQEKDLKDSLTRFGLVDPVLVNMNSERKNIIIGGHQRTKVWESMGHRSIECIELNLSIEKEKELNVRLNKNTGIWNNELLKDHFDFENLIDWGFTAGELFEKESKEILEANYHDEEEKWFLNIEFKTEKETQIWYEKLTKENLTLKIIQ